MLECVVAKSDLIIPIYKEDQVYTLGSATN